MSFFVRISHVFPSTFLRVVAANSFVEWLKKINASIYIFKYIHKHLKANISNSKIFKFCKKLFKKQNLKSIQCKQIFRGFLLCTSRFFILNNLSVTIELVFSGTIC
jgi:hypothetical protein